MNVPTLFDALQSIPDHRTRKGRRFPLATILAISLAAMLSGANDLMAIFRWGRRLSPKALQALGADKKRKKAPCHATYHYVFQSLSEADLLAALGVLVKSADGLGHVTIDGKRLRGSQRETSPGVHMLNAFSTKLQAAVGSLVVPPDSGECVEALELIRSLPLAGAVVTGDAAFTMKPIVEAIRERGGDYFLFVKANQPELQTELARPSVTFPPRDVVSAIPLTAAERRDPPDLKRAATTDKGHGRIETRRIAVRTKLPARLDQSWPGITAICRIERIRETKDRCSREVIYAITSLAADKLDAASLLQLSRDHWQIENRLFHVRDVTFKEDASRVRSGSAHRSWPVCATPRSPSSAASTTNQGQPAKPSPPAPAPPSPPS